MNEWFHNLHHFQASKVVGSYSPQVWATRRIAQLYDYLTHEGCSGSFECVLHIEILRKLIRSAIAKLGGDVDRLDAVCDMFVVHLMIDFPDKHEGSLTDVLFRQLPRSTVDLITKNLEAVCLYLPKHMLERPNSGSLASIKWEFGHTMVSKTHKVFCVPMLTDENVNALDRNHRRSAAATTFDAPAAAKLFLPPASATASKSYGLLNAFNTCKSNLNEFTYATFQQIVKSELESTKSDEEVLNYFLDTFGCELFVTLSEIVAHRRSINYNADDNLSLPSKGKTGELKARQRQQQQRESNRERESVAIVGQITAQSETERLMAKNLRKLDKKMILPVHNEHKNALEADKYLFQPLQRGSVKKYPHVHDQLLQSSVSAKYNGMTLKYPANTIKEDTKTHVSFTIPGASPSSASNIPHVGLVQISSLDPIGQIIFKDIKRLNRIQSEVFPTAYHTNENMLICAPTGAGKTNIALLAIAHEINAHMEGGVLRTNDFKIVYVCPMKALATEMVATFKCRLSPIGVRVREVTGDTQLTRREMAETQVLVTTPEKWDVISRKGVTSGDDADSASSLLRLLILDEVHLLNTDRGPVIEALVARTLRQVVSSQSVIRIVALSATLPGYLDVAQFLKVNPERGLFFFDHRFRSIPLSMTFIGMRKDGQQTADALDAVCYEQIENVILGRHKGALAATSSSSNTNDEDASVSGSRQVMVFVTSRNLTVTTARNLLGLARDRGQSRLFESDTDSAHRMLKQTHFKMADLDTLVPFGFGVHHAGMCRHDRLGIESLFRAGALKVIVCTTTLAWGVNLPAHAVIIRGTTRYDAQKSGYVDMDVLDIQQIFGRAGRPQYDTSGHGIIITAMANMANYMAMLTSQVPIESQFLNFVPDNLNAEIVLGTVSNLKEAIEWLSNTFLYCRIQKNPLVYGLTFTDLWDGGQLIPYLERHLSEAARRLETARMIRFSNTTGELQPTAYGRIASFYYVGCETMLMIHQNFHRRLSDADIMLLLCRAHEFQNIQVRNDELDELERLNDSYNHKTGGILVNVHVLDPTSVEYKVLTLMQANINHVRIMVSSLVSDCEFIMQTLQRLSRALFEIAVDQMCSDLALRCLRLSQMLELRTPIHLHPLRQFGNNVTGGALDAVARHLALIEGYSVEELATMSERVVADLAGNVGVARRVLHLCRAFPRLQLSVDVKPITDDVLRIRLLVECNFLWDVAIHGTVQHYYAWVQDSANCRILRFESFVVARRQGSSSAADRRQPPIELVFTIPLNKQSTLNEYAVVVANSKYMFAETQESIDLSKLNIISSSGRPIETKFLCVAPVPISALHNNKFQLLYQDKFTYFNAVQSQVFFTCYNTDTNVLLGAPTGSGKTIVAELCMLRLFNFCAESARKYTVCYVAPMKALVRERVKDWTDKFAKINKKVVEVTGDLTPHSSLLEKADIIITTPEKWDGMSRNWLQRSFVRAVKLLIIDEIHLLAEERGPVLEAIVSRMNYINSRCSLALKAVRIVGLSTAMANASDLANWLNIQRRGLYNFSSAVRPVPLEIHLRGFAVKHYCPRMATMNRPAYQAICQYAPHSPTLIFVSSRKQTRITAYDLMRCLLSDTNPKQWLRCSVERMEQLRQHIIDKDLSYLLMFGIGIHHAGLEESDRNAVEALFVEQKIQVLVATATLAWGVNFPAHLVIVKGTEYFDGATKRYVDMPVTDILQMLGRAGRPQFDTSGVACVFVQECKKGFYHKFLFEPFPVESSLLHVLPEHVNAEIASGTIASRPQLVDFICSTFFFRRLIQNPTYYTSNPDASENVNVYLEQLSGAVLDQLQQWRCIQAMPCEDDVYEDVASSQGANAAVSMENCYGDMERGTGSVVGTNNRSAFNDQRVYQCTFLGSLAAQYYLACKTVHFLDTELKAQCSYDDLLDLICQVNEYSHFPVRHNEDNINKQLCKTVEMTSTFPFDSPQLKVLLLIKCYLLNVPMPNQEYVLDLKSVFDQIIRIMEAMIVLAAAKRWLDTTKRLIKLAQMICQGVHTAEEMLVGHADRSHHATLLSAINGFDNIFVRFHTNRKRVMQTLDGAVADARDRAAIVDVLRKLPVIHVRYRGAGVLSRNAKCIELDVEPDTGCHQVFDFELESMQQRPADIGLCSRRFKKQKDTGWFVVMALDDEVVHLQRVLLKVRHKNVSIRVQMPPARGIYTLDAYFLSDSYLGLDQKITFRLRIRPSPAHEIMTTSL